jgi:hypothetical protein
MRDILTPSHKIKEPKFLGVRFVEAKLEPGIAATKQRQRSHPPLPTGWLSHGNY